MSDILNYTDFRTASYRNLHVCKELLLSLDSCERRNEKHILHKVFYLSGYIIEFCYKYSLFYKLNIGEYDNIYKYQDGIFKSKWQQHDYNKLRSLCNDNHVIFCTDIPYFGSKVKNREVEKLLNAWNVQIRYSLSLSNYNVPLEKENLKELVKLIEDILNKITSKFS